MYMLNLDREEVHILIAAAAKGLRGNEPLCADKEREDALLDKLISLGKKLN